MTSWPPSWKSMSYQKPNSVNWCIFTLRTILQNCIPIRFETSEPQAFCARQHICYSAYMLSPVFRLSVRLSVTRMDQSKRVEDRIMQLSPQSSPMSLVSSWLISPQNSKGNIGSGDSKQERGRSAYFMSKSVFDAQGCRVLTLALARLSCLKMGVPTTTTTMTTRWEDQLHYGISSRSKSKVFTITLYDDRQLSMDLYTQNKISATGSEKYAPFDTQMRALINILQISKFNSQHRVKIYINTTVNGRNLRLISLHFMKVFNTNKSVYNQH